MSIMLYGAIVASLRQGWYALERIVGRAQAHFRQQGTPLREIVDARLPSDMLRLYGLPSSERVCTDRPRLEA